MNSLAIVEDKDTVARTILHESCSFVRVSGTFKLTHKIASSGIRGFGLI